MAILLLGFLFMFGAPRTWLQRRWYRSLLPVALVGCVAQPIAELLCGKLSHLPEDFSVACLVGFSVGLLWSALSVTVAQITLMQMSTSVRVAMLAMFTSLSVLAMNRMPGQIDIANHYFAEGMAIFLGAMTARWLTGRHQKTFDDQRTLTGPASRDLGLCNPTGDRILIGYLAALLMVLHCWERSSHWWDLGTSLAYASSSFLLGVASTLAVVSRFFSRRRWGTFVSALLVVASALVVGSFSNHWQLDAGSRSLPSQVGLLISTVAAWLVGMRLLGKYLQVSRWRWKKIRSKVSTFVDGRMNLTATDRTRNLMEQHGWCSVAGAFSIALGLSIPCQVGATLLPEANFPSAMLPANFQSNSLETEDVLQGICLMAMIGCTWASCTVIAIAAIHHFPTLVSQTVVVSVTLVCMSIIIQLAGDKFAQVNLLTVGWIVVIALPAVLLSRIVVGFVNRWSRFRVGVAAVRKRTVQIRSIMSLTMLVGIEIAVIRALVGRLTIEEMAAVAAAGVTGLVFLVITLNWLRRSIGRKTILNGLSILLWTVIPFGIAIYLLSVFVDIHWFLSFFFGLLFLASYGWTVILQTDWLRSQGWQIQKNGAAPQ